MSDPWQQVRGAEDYHAAYSYFLARADQAAQEVLPGAQFEVEDGLLECPSSTGGKLYYSVVYTRPGEDLTDPDRPAVVVHVYGSTAQAVQGKGANTSIRTKPYRQVEAYLADIRWQKVDNGYEPVALPTVVEEHQMKPCAVMQHLVTQLLTQHGVDLADPEAYLKLRVPGDVFMPLVIERIGPTRLSVAHYYVCDELSGELAADPDVEIFIGADPWIPLAIQHPPPFGYVVTAELAEDGRRVERLNRKAQADLAAFCNQWARNLQDQGFLTAATVVGKKTWPAATPPTTMIPPPATAISSPTMTPPSLAEAPQQLPLW